MKSVFTIIFVVLFSGLGIGQHLSFQEMKGLLDVAGSEPGISKYLTERGFEKNADDNLDKEKGIKSLYFKKKIGKRDYFVTVVRSLNGNDHLVRELSKDKKRTEYYKEVVSSNGFKEVDPKSANKNESETRYNNKEFELTISRSQGLDGTYYAISLKRI